MKKGTPPQIPGLVYVQPLGSGGYADVFLYEQQSPRMPVAVKVLKGEGLTDALRSQFVEEADTMAQLGDHPYIVQVFRSGAADDGRPYLVMKYYPPPNLAMRARADRFSVEEVLRTGIQLASAVETAHRASITHRDIKPANVLVSAYGAPGLTDFGIAGRGGREGDGAEAESTDDIGVSVPWAPPEVLYGQSNGDVRSDIYSLAATLWQLLVGRSPFEVPGGDNSAYALMPRIRSTPVPSTGRQDVPAGLERLLGQAMAKEPRSRPATALEFARALQSVEQGQRLTRTPIVVLDEQGHTTLVSQTSGSPVGPGGDDDRTRIKAPQTVIAQPSPTLLDDETRRRPTLPAARQVPAPAHPTVVAGSAAGTGSVSRSYSSAPLRASARTDPTTSNTSPLTSDLAEETTVRRGSVTAGQPTPAPASARGSAGLGSPMVLWALVAGVAVLLGLVAFLVLRPTGTGSVDPAAVQPRPSPTVQMPGDDSAIGEGVFDRPTVRAESGPGRVTFSWTYPSPARTDTFVIGLGPTSAAANQDQGTRVATTTHTVKVAKGVQVCAYVKVVRAGQTSPPSDPTCDTAL